MSETPIVQEAEQTTQTCLQHYCTKKMALKSVKESMKELEKEALRNPDYVAKKLAVKELNDDLKNMKEDLMAELDGNEVYQELRKLHISNYDATAHAREALFKKIHELPPEPTQLTFDFEGSEHKAEIQNDRKLYINGKLDTPV